MGTGSPEVRQRGNDPAARWFRRLHVVLAGVLTVVLVAVVVCSVWEVANEGAEPGELILYSLAGLLIVAVFAPLLFTWPWMAGLAACFAIAMVLTPADPQSVLIVAVPLSAFYLLGVLFWKRSRSARCGSD